MLPTRLRIVLLSNDEQSISKLARLASRLLWLFYIVLHSRTQIDDTKKILTEHDASVFVNLIDTKLLGGYVLHLTETDHQNENSKQT